ncbi:DUF2314 domain-containing protein [Antarctobacter jejuensis]|uniref:DUF2314 domain-containing protein n=1 Tax=Antarctobacter jejuensis TaxID=1439938 RepID=UPI003FCEF5F4
MTAARVLTLLLWGALATAAPAQGLPFTADEDGMRAAMEEARTQLDLALSQLTDDKGRIHPALNLKIKIPIQHLDIEEEMLWVDQLSIEDGRYAGTVANAPAYLKGTRLGDAVRFDRAQIVDWSVLDTSGLMYGHYTTRVLLKTLEPAQAQAVQDLLTPDPLPEAWR